MDNHLVKQAIVLCGGLGNRLRSVVSDVPKPMAPIGAKPFLSYVLNYLCGQGVEKVYLSVGYKWTIIHDYFGEHYGDLTLEYVIEDRQLGTGGALLLTAQRVSLNKPVVVLNGDTWFPVILADVMDFHISRKADMTIVLAKSPKGTRYDYIQLNDNDEIISLGSNELYGAKLINGGFYIIIPSQIFCYIRNENQQLSLEKHIIPDMIEDKKNCLGYISTSEFLDIGIPADYGLANELLKKNNVLA